MTDGTENVAGLRPPLRDPSERLSADDQATQREAEFLQRAMLRQQQQRARRPADVPGTCSNCGERCEAPAVYCDEDCRSDHEAREARAR